MIVRYYRTSSGREPVREYLDGLPQAALEMVLKDLRHIREHGLDSFVVTRHLKDKLWEIKTGAGRQQRIFYCIITGPVMVFLHACKKQKEAAQRDDVELAYKRMKEVL